MSPVVTPAYLIRSYAWQVLKRNMPTVWDESKYGGLEPIVPLSEEPELNDFSGPHIVYGYADDASSHPARRMGSMTFAVYDDNFRRLTQTMTILQTALCREDETATDINRFTTVQPGMLGLTFGYVRLGFMEGGSPEETEGGRQSALLGITYEYHVDYDVVTRIV